jgi:hypothetical protein
MPFLTPGSRADAQSLVRCLYCLGNCLCYAINCTASAIHRWCGCRILLHTAGPSSKSQASRSSSKLQQLQLAAILLPHQGLQILPLLPLMQLVLLLRRRTQLCHFL